MMEATASRGAGKLAVSRAGLPPFRPSARAHTLCSAALCTSKPHAFRRFVGTELAAATCARRQRALGTSGWRLRCSTTCR